jgi:ribosome-associated heat shock protein Hsp15
MVESKPVRIDKFLWSVRIYKTRSLAADACRKGKIIVNNVQVKPSRTIQKDEIITVRKLPVTYTYQVILPLENRTSPKLVQLYLKDLTPEEEKARLLTRQNELNWHREKGAGRPTKKERRVIEKFRHGSGSF